jgi:RNA polymerase sigma-70 factor (ECF subfamily)
MVLGPLQSHPDDASGSGRPEPDFDKAFDLFVEQHYARLCNFALRLLRSPDAAEDAVQEVLYKIWDRRTIENVRDPVPYLYQAVRNQCLMVLRSERRWHTTEVEIGTLVHDTADDDADLFDLQRGIARAIDALPERTRLVFTMHRQQELTYNDIARILGISVKTVETQMTRALKILRRNLDQFFR